MTPEQKQFVKDEIAKAYKKGPNNHAYYLELCLRTDSLPR